MTEEEKGLKKGVKSRKTESAGEANLFTKEQLLASAHFCDRRDMVEALLTAGERYTIKDVEEKIREYKKGKVR